MGLLLIDNYDSFTYNIVELLRRCHAGDVTILKNDEVTIKLAASFDKIIVSPGPGIPAELPHVSGIIRELAPSKNILGICLGCQTIVTTFGGQLKNLPQPNHGQRKKVQVINDHSLFKKLPNEFFVGLYHSWYIDPGSLPGCFIVTCSADEGMIMALKHEKYNIHGVLFHPESYMTEFGEQLMKNWLMS